MAPPEPILSLIENYPIPVLCDSLSNLRNRSFPNGILRYENILRNSKLAKSLKPDLIITLGPLPTSKLLRTWLDHQGIKRVIIEPRGINVDPLASTSTSFQVNYSILPELSFEKLEDTWLDIWKNLEKSIEDKLDLHFEQDNDINEPKLIRLLSNHLPRNSQLHIANSMPMRDLEWFWRSGQVDANLFGNRGVNGIDGTLGTALGLAHQSKKPTFLLTGELAFLHDSNALLFSSFFKGSLTIILINNDGGGIFEHLPISQHEAFEKCFATPQSCSFQKLCEAHEIDYKIPSTWEEIIQEIESPFPSGIRLIEVMTDRKKNKKLRDNLLAISGAD
jgi:2-succinyl-5-enolpyruvyl-6-hydroxy-3-cyclohexene-1-carboxylate synthase